MSIKILIDMNLSPEWSSVFRAVGWTATHWAEVGDPRASDRILMDWAISNDYIVFTHDLDFGTILALTHKTGPSVLQVRGEDVLPSHMANLVTEAIAQHEVELKTGALIVIDERKRRVRILPI
jgi:predicted nuclease of predicted toxin-antitoxin system